VGSTAWTRAPASGAPARVTVPVIVRSAVPSPAAIAAINPSTPGPPITS
jgi:hypothetical protein